MLFPAVGILLMTASALTVTSPAFESGQAIPAKHSCSGADVSPEISWTSGPAGTKSYALIVDDPDAPGGTFVHWVVYDFKPDAQAGRITLAEGAAGRSLAGQNGFGKSGYGGPCPPPGKTHHYRFHVYASSRDTLGLAAGASAAQVRSALNGNTLADGVLVGTFER
jgi:Raf kinase inhibitor-like YbhB/YbcL family protein